jgi:hypothetical protein
VNGWSALPSVSAAKFIVGGPSTWVLEEAGSSTSGLGGNNRGEWGFGKCSLSRAMLHLPLSSSSDSGMSKGLSRSPYSILPAPFSLLSWCPQISPSKPSSFSELLASSSFFFFGKRLFVILVTVLHDKCYIVSEIISPLDSALKPGPSAGADPECEEENAVYAHPYCGVVWDSDCGLNWRVSLSTTH